MGLLGVRNGERAGSAIMPASEVFNAISVPIAHARMHPPKWRTKAPLVNKANSVVYIRPLLATGGGVLNVVGCSG